MSRSAFDAVVSQAEAIPDLRRSRPLWIAIAGVPIAALLAFLIVRSFGGATDEPASPETTPVSRVEVGAPEVTKPELTKPEVTKPELTKPELTKPAVTKPEVKNVAVARPVTPVPAVKRPEPPVKARLRLTIIGGGPTPEIKIDGAASSADAMVTPGVHTVDIKSKGMVAQRFTVEVGKGGMVRRVALLPRPAPVVPVVEDGTEILQPGQLQSGTPKRRRSR